MVYGSSRVAERVPAEATKASRVGRRRTREAVLLVSVPRAVVDGDLFAGFNEAFEVKVGLSTLAEVGVPQQFGIGAVVVSMVCHDGVLGPNGIAVDVCHVSGGRDDVALRAPGVRGQRRWSGDPSSRTRFSLHNSMRSDSRTH